MLTIHTPIGLTVDSSILTISDNFAERLTGNYHIIGNGLEPEEMLHFIAEPPEVYLAEGGMTSLIENQTIYENQNLKMDVVNNVLNRILVSDTYEMTYQDRVFVEAVLKKMGVTDVKKFMHQVQDLKEETKNVSYLTDLYWSQSETLSELFEYRKMQEKPKAEAGKEKEETTQQVLWLHQQIMNRLQTGALYQEMKNFLSSSVSHHQRISRQEMQVAEQSVTAQNILLNKLRNYTMLEKQPLVYHYLNAYEIGEENTVYEDSRQTMQQMIQAVLLNAVHQMYALRMEEMKTQENAWYQLAETVYQTAENTFRRFEAYHNKSFFTEKDADIYRKNVQQYQRNEIQALQQIYEREHTHLVREIRAESWPESELAYLPLAEEEDGGEWQAEETTAGMIEQIQQIRQKEQQISSRTIQENLQKNQTVQIRQNNTYSQQLLQHAADQAEKESTLILEHVRDEEADETGAPFKEERQHGQQILPVSVQEKLLKERLDQINQNNIQNKQLLQQLSIQLGEEKEPLQVNRAKAREDALKMLTEPDAVMLDYLESQTRVEQKQLTERETLKTVLGEETVRIFETLEKYQKSPQYKASVRATGDGETKLIQDIYQQEQERQTQLFHKTQELTQEDIHEDVTKQMFREYLPENVRQVKQEVKRHIERAEIVHKQTENTLEEEMLEEIRGISRSAHVQQEQIKEQVVEKTVSHEIINTRINEIQTRQNEELMRMITDKMQRQIGSISEQVYGKLEKRMDAERRRRGL